MRDAGSGGADSSGHVRTAQIGAILIISAASSSAVQIGDRGETNARLQALAVQRAESHATAGEFYFESYPMFSRPYPVLRDPEFESGAALAIDRRNESPCIRVGFIRVIASGAASSIQAGNNMRIRADSRIKHTRQFPRRLPVDQSAEPQADQPEGRQD